MTNTLLYEILPHFLLFPSPGEEEDEDEDMDSTLASRRDSGIVEWCLFGLNKYDGATEDLLPQDGDILAPGLYVVLCPGKLGFRCLRDRRVLKAWFSADGANIPVRISKEKYPKRILPQCRTARLSRSVKSNQPSPS